MKQCSRVIFVKLIFLISFLIIFSVVLMNINTSEEVDTFQHQSNNDASIFRIDPDWLFTKLNHSTRTALKERFGFDEPNASCLDCITLGTFSHQIDQKLIDFEEENPTLKKIILIQGMEPFNESNVQLHIFYQNSSKKVHLVVFHRVQNFFWIGRIPPNQRKLFPKIHYGLNEEIYDLFDSKFEPNEIAHFLSQQPSSRYIHCPNERRQWFSKNNITISSQETEAFERSLVAMKCLMKSLQMQFWMACGTLLGWFRQCHITPYTTDVDFVTWSKYALNGNDLHTELNQTVAQHQLSLYSKFGHPNFSLEYSFYQASTKIDLFFIYPNQSHYLMPIHVMPYYVYQAYPKYFLCSGELLGHKLLVPCQPETLITVEYGGDWMKPITKWNYHSDPKNVASKMLFPKNLTQYQQF